VLATSTDEALKKIARQRFDAIISDMGRPPDPRAGYTIIEQLHSSGDRTSYGPLINLLTDAKHCDPISATPFHKYVPVRLTPAPFHSHA
jgi:CheY-like chemotaxis protein